MKYIGTSATVLLILLYSSTLHEEETGGKGPPPFMSSVTACEPGLTNDPMLAALHDARDAKLSFDGGITYIHIKESFRKYMLDEQDHATTRPGCPPLPDYCYMIADGDNTGTGNSPLLKYTYATNSLKLLNRLGVGNVEASTLSMDGKILYATNGGVLGTINPTAGAVGSFNPINSSGPEIGNGELGRVVMDDIDGLSFNPVTNILYGSVRYKRNSGRSLDLLIQLDHTTGTLIKDAFDPGIDYIVIQSDMVEANDVDGIAIDSEGTLFSVVGNSGTEGKSHLVVIDTLTGAVSDLGELHNNGGLVQDMEGLTLYSQKYLFGTTGVQQGKGNTGNTLYLIERNTGRTKAVTPLDQNFDGYIPKDIEAISCFPVCK